MLVVLTETYCNKVNPIYCNKVIKYIAYGIPNAQNKTCEMLNGP